jgi:hypothetical protein
MFYLKVEEVSDSDFSKFKILNIIKNLLLLSSWFISSSSNGVQLENVELEPDYGEDDDNQGNDSDDQDPD